jgi:hypothetical protein
VDNDDHDQEGNDESNYGKVLESNVKSCDQELAYDIRKMNGYPDPEYQCNQTGQFLDKPFGKSV